MSNDFVVTNSECRKKTQETFITSHDKDYLFQL